MPPQCAGMSLEMGLLARVEVTPYYGQVYISDPHTHDYPQFETGNEIAVATPDRIAVMTQGDQSGKVSVEVWSRRMDVEGVDLLPVFEGDLLLTKDRAIIGNTVGSEFYSDRTTRWPGSRESLHVGNAGLTQLGLLPGRGLKSVELGQCAEMCLQA
jgi:hypothetical protein